MRHELTTAVWVGFLLSFAPNAMAEYVNPCQGKHWLTQPVSALAEISSTGDSGMGGTGHQLPSIPPHLLSVREGGEGDGIGGTGIIGVIAGFGSICVAGREIHYDNGTPVIIDGKSAGPSVFGLGQMVSVRSRETSEGFVAAEILVLHEVRGPVEAISRENRSLQVLGQKIEFAGPIPDLAQVGQAVAVSGFRLPDGRIEATRLARGEGQGVSLIGAVESTAETTFVVAGQQIRLARPGPMPAIGSEVRIEGMLRANVLEVDRWVPNPRLAYSAPVERIFVQGHVRNVEAGVANLDGVSIRFKENSEKVKMGDRIEALIELGGAGRMEAKKWSVEPRVPRMLLPRPDLQGGVGTPPLRPTLRPDIPRGNSRVDMIRPNPMGPPAPPDRPRPNLPERPGIRR